MPSLTRLTFSKNSFAEMKSCSITNCNELTSIVFGENSFYKTPNKLNISYLPNLYNLRFKRNSFQNVQTVILEGMIIFSV